MTEREETREELEADIAWELRAKKILLICTAVCSGICLVGGMIYSILLSRDNLLVGICAGIFFGVWIGPGLGSAVSLFPVFNRMHKVAKEKGEEGDNFIFNLLLFLAFLFIGPVSLIIRILRINHIIKKLKKRISRLPQ